MLAWTAAGAVHRPRTLQIRLSRTYPERVRAGAPVPTRSLTTEEVDANLAWFTAASTRGLPIDALVLSGQGVAARPDLPAILTRARALGVARITLHVGVADLAALAPAEGGPAGGDPAGKEGVAAVDRYVLPVLLGPDGADSAALRDAFTAARAAGVRVDANAPLVASGLPHLAAAAAIAVAGGASSLTFTYPFPTGADVAPPPVRDAVAALHAVVPRVLEAAGDILSLAIKGLPACYLGALAGYLRRSGNRWYVDADHQQDRALLFFPGVVAFTKADDCRFCAADPTCDGFFAAWLARPGTPPLRPLDP
jgi:hypothetical protein